MINSYCRVCGLYISAPEDFAGGRGACPRCKTSLRIPRPLGKDDPAYVAGLRYLSFPSGEASDEGSRPAICEPAMGASSRYACEQCGEKFESLKRTGWVKGLCPRCSHVNRKPRVRSVAFPRQYAGQGSAPVGEPVARPAPAASDDFDMDGEFLLAHPAVNQAPGDSVMEGIPLSANGLEDAPGLAMNDTRRSSPRAEAEASAVEGEGLWMYLLRGRQQGPVSGELLREMIREGRLSASALVWREGMEGWQPAESLEHFRVLPGEAAAPEAVGGAVALTPAQRSRQLVSSSVTLGWTVTALVCVTLLSFIARQSFAELGMGLYLVADVVVGLVTLGALGYAGWMIGRHSAQVVRLPMPAKLRLGVSTLGLLGCLVWVIVMATMFTRPSSPPAEVESLQRAEHVRQILAEGDLRGTYRVIDWENLRVNGDDFGQRYRQASLLREREALIRGLLRRLSAVAAVPEDEDGNAEGWRWQVHHRTVYETTVVGTHPAGRRSLVLQFQGGGMVTHIEAERSEAPTSLPTTRSAGEGGSGNGRS